jgi:NADH dehydrogenase (ubiquinone) 1 alpha subcomplex subunit 9
MSLFTEDWNESQFWVRLLFPLSHLYISLSADTYNQYSDETASHLAKQLLDGATPDMTIVVVSAPSVFVQLKNLVVSIASNFSSPAIRRLS